MKFAIFVLGIWTVLWFGLLADKFVNAKIKNDSSIADDTKRIADLLEIHWEPKPILLSPQPPPSPEEKALGEVLKEKVHFPQSAFQATPKSTFEITPGNIDQLCASVGYKPDGLCK